MSLIRKHVAVLQAWACLDLVDHGADYVYVGLCPFRAASCLIIMW